jgi:hypothetical protein
LDFRLVKVFENRPYNRAAPGLYFLDGRRVKRAEVDMRTLELKPEDFPLAIRLHVAGGSKEYVLVKTKQDKLLLNKPLENLADKR